MDGSLQPRDPSGLRISDSDRHKVAEVLREAAGDGRIDLAELDERLEAAYSAKTYGELVPITADLPAHAGSHPAPALTGGPVGRSHPSSVAVMSETKRQGSWLVGDTHSAFALMGSVTLDLREAQFAGHEVVITASAIMAEVKVVVNAETAVIVDGVAIMGEFKEQRPKTDPRLTPQSPVVRVKGLALMGTVNVQRRARPDQARLRLRGPR
jgi:hypothetical protein